MSLDKLDFKHIFTDNFLGSVTPERRQEIKEEAGKERRYILRAGYGGVSEFLFKKAEEIAYSTKKHEDKTDAEKALLAANIAIIDDKRFDEALKNCGFTANSLRTYIMLLALYKKGMVDKRNGDSIPTDTSKSDKSRHDHVESAIEKYTDALTKRLQVYFGNVSPSIIINKINEIFAYADAKQEEATWRIQPPRKK